MKFRALIRRCSSKHALLIMLTLGAAGLFKVSAFARETFIAAKFGLSAITDAYFGLQQFPLTLGTFMFGAFGLAFVPAYADARRRSGSAAWLRGLLVYGVAAGLALTVMMLVGGSFLLRTIHSTPTRDIRLTLAILSICYLPIVTTGIWAGMHTASGRYLSGSLLSGMPYLLMTLALFGIYAAGRLNNLSLPISMAAGFGLVGAYSLVRIVASEGSSQNISKTLAVWRFPDFKVFLRQLVASSIENGGFATNQLLMLHFVSQSGTGALSANNCAMRVGMLGYSLVSQPLAQLIQSRLCILADGERERFFRRAVLVTAGLILALAIGLFLLRYPAIRIVYMHGKFTLREVNEVVAILPAWIGYFVVMSMNGIVARFLFIRSQGSLYVRRQLLAYAGANLLRFAIAGSFGAAFVIWCSVLAESVALAANIRTCVSDADHKEAVARMAVVESYDVQPL